MKQFLLSVILLIFTFSQSFAQSSKIEMADTMRSNGMIYVVVAVLAIVLSGVILYVINVDRKISKIEKEINQ